MSPPRTAHGTQLIAGDIATLAEHDVRVAHGPVCNAKLVSGTMDRRAIPRQQRFWARQLRREQEF